MKKPIPLTMPFKVEVSLRVPSNNQLIKWKRYRIGSHKLAIHQAFEKAFKDRVLPVIREGGTLKFIRRGPRKLDQDNLEGGLKYVQDALVSWGIFPDDNPDVLTRLPSEQEKSKEYSLLIIINQDQCKKESI